MNLQNISNSELEKEISRVKEIIAKTNSVFCKNDQRKYLRRLLVLRNRRKGA